MPWTHPHPMLERAAFIEAHQRGLYSTAELARRYGVSRKTAYKWLDRYRSGGLEALTDRSHAARSHPDTTPPEVEALLVEARRKHPTWGPRKLLPYLRQRHPDVRLPAASTVGAILKRNGLVEPRRRRRKNPHPGSNPGSTPIRAEAPGDLWCTDFKGEFKTLDGVYCYPYRYPLTVADACSRFVLCCQGLPSTKQQGVIPVFERIFNVSSMSTVCPRRSAPTMAFPSLRKRSAV